ncbi:MAG TPA: BON domain-containing protein [Candidatus Dormibacteraeota bacterium]|nr:BON domain-containing protein [Candidatus Dormibacteraeota bacterium]
MKSKLFTTLALSIFATLTLTAAQTPTTVPSQGNPAANPVTPDANQSQTSVNQNGQVSPNGQASSQTGQAGQVQTPGNDATAFTPANTATNGAFAGTNGFSGGTGTDATGGTGGASTNVNGTAQVGGTNGTNLAGTSTGSQQDQALNESDRTLLTQIRQSAFGSLSPTGATSEGNVHFILLNGAVRLVGTVPNAAERTRIENAVSKVPGVTRVFNALTVGSGTAPTGTPGEPVTTPQGTTQGTSTGTP